MSPTSGDFGSTRARPPSQGLSVRVLRTSWVPEELLRTLPEQVAPIHTAAVVVDVQKDFCASDGAMARQLGLDLGTIQGAVPRLNRFIEECRASGVPVVWLREVFSPSTMLPNHRV